MTKHVGDAGYTDVELQTMINKMHGVTEVFYPMAAATGCHTFIEFCGLMNEFIKICEQSLAAGVDFATASTHTGKPLVVHQYNAAYLVEKLDCIFGPSIHASKEVEAEFAKLTTGPLAELRQRVKVFCDFMAEALGAEPLTEEEHDLDVLAETLITTIKQGERDSTELHGVMNAIATPFGKRYRSIKIEDIGSKEKVQGEGIVLPELPGSTTMLATEMMRQHVDVVTKLREASAELLATLVVHATPAAGSPVDIAAKKLNDLVKAK